ncbi:WD repeat-containing protein jip5 [Scheffersomyces spartinae]|uniref:WD repeat-containing protein JIP5 n=1 Tax=Scheffersomyces spartinae TaxID=45513 RepID=A0A9P7VE36_9ASCO|nr:WD repeat-containing protein jip5 [Scheffersomyces spartinae]KAG7196281.1 WD repeat-containing protein jip5 [Scheffersomyces spartinae]
MAKSKNKKKSKRTELAAREIELRVAPILEVQYTEPLFTVAAHPTEPVIVSGLATGHVYCNRYDAEALEDQQRRERERIASSIRSVSQLKNKWWEVTNYDAAKGSLYTTLWKTKRHKGSCRSVIFDPTTSNAGKYIYTVGSDNVIKKATAETGKVASKVDIVKEYQSKGDSVTKLCHSSTHDFLLAGTENGLVLVFDSKNLGSSIKYSVAEAHEDAINHILPMPHVSAYHYLTLGLTTLSHIDIRKGIITQSDNQEDELLSMCYPTDDTMNDTVLVGHGEGIVTIWKNSKNKFMDQLSRIKVNKGVSIDCIVPSMNEDLPESVWCGDSDGFLHRLDYRKGKVVETRLHSNATEKHGAIDEVGILDIDYNYRLISAGMDSLKIWSGSGNEEQPEAEVDDESDDDSEDSADDMENSDKEDNSDSDSDINDDSDSESDLNESDSDGSSENDSKAKSVNEKKRKVVDINKLTAKGNEHGEEKEESEPARPKKKVKQLSTKQLRNLQRHEHGIKRFDGL